MLVIRKSRLSLLSSTTSLSFSSLPSSVSNVSPVMIFGSSTDVGKTIISAGMLFFHYYH